MPKIDIPAMTEALRANLNAQRTDAPPGADEAWMRAQTRFNEAMVQFNVALCENDNDDELDNDRIVGAAAIAAGNIVASAVMGFDDNPEQMEKMLNQILATVARVIANVPGENAMISGIDLANYEKTDG